MIFREREAAAASYGNRAVTEKGQKDAFSVISDKEWNPYAFRRKRQIAENSRKCLRICGICGKMTMKYQLNNRVFV